MAIDTKQAKTLTVGDVVSYRLFFQEEIDEEGVPTGSMIEMCELTCNAKWEDGTDMGIVQYSFPIDDPTWKSDQIGLVTTYALPAANVLHEEKLT